LTWGSASLHPRLYAFATLRGLSSNNPVTSDTDPAVDAATFASLRHQDCQVSPS
jgi:hypothetical protein